ncbi:MAG: MFS transporter [Verrucomicrobiae bacterium]|nr:MFS transporter [Verrucomicrobiae bacterium]
MSHPPSFRKDPVYEHWRWRIFAITWLAYAGYYLTRKSFSVAKIEMGKPGELGLSHTEMAWIDGGFLVAYALGQFVWGLSGDRFGTRRVILTGMMGSVVAAVAMGLAVPEWLPVPLQTAVASVAGPWGVSVVAFLLGGLFFAQGLFQASGWAPLAKNMAQFFSRLERGTVIGLWCTNYAAGGFIASIFAGYVGERFGWRAAFLVPAFALAGVWLLFWRFQRNRPEDVGLPPIETYHGEPPEVRPDAESDSSTDAGGSRWAVAMEVLRTPMVRLLCVIYFCLKPTRYAILFWGPKYIHDRLGTGMIHSGFLSAMFEAAGPLSVLLAGLFSDKLFGSRRMPVAVICLGLLALLLFMLDRLPPNAWILGASLFLLGLLTYAPDSLVSGTAALDFGSKRGASTASGIINGCGSIGAIVGGTLPGFLQEQGGWHAVFTFLGAAVLLAALLLLPRWNTLPSPAAKAT